MSDSIADHIREWRDSVEVDTDVAVFRVVQFHSTAFPDGAPYAAVIARLYPPDWPNCVDPVEGVRAEIGSINHTKRVRRVA